MSHLCLDSPIQLQVSSNTVLSHIKLLEHIFLTLIFWVHRASWSPFPSQSQVISLNMSLGHHPASCKGIIPHPPQPTRLSWCWGDTQSEHTTSLGTEAGAGQGTGTTSNWLEAAQNVSGAQVGLGLSLLEVSFSMSRFVIEQMCTLLLCFREETNFLGDSALLRLDQTWVWLKEGGRKPKHFPHFYLTPNGENAVSFPSIWGKYFLFADILLRGDKSFIVIILVGI